jgi:hypothetical protein
MLSAGVLKPDQHQQQLVQQLSELLKHLQQYSQQVEAYRVSRAAYEVGGVWSGCCSVCDWVGGGVRFGYLTCLCAMFMDIAAA